MCHCVWRYPCLCPCLCLCLTRRPNFRQQSAHRNSLPFPRAEFGDRAVFENLDFDRALVGLDHSKDVALVNGVPRLDQPFDKFAAFHVGTQRRHEEVGHDGRTSFRTASTISSVRGSAASSICAA